MTFSLVDPSRPVDADGGADRMQLDRGEVKLADAITALNNALEV